MKKLSILASMLFLFGCSMDVSPQGGATEGSKAKKVLIQNGFKIKEEKGIVIMGCSEEDSVFTSRRFIAEKNGISQEVTVCCGLLFKGCTIRF